jgi:transglutaminase-like putative cysteine protease/tetratricopeptide (TPR) repeat protein
VESVKAAEPGLPGDMAPYPYLVVAPRSSWADLAARYQTIVNERIAQGDVKAIPLPPAKSKETALVVRDTLAFLHDNVRYTGLEFGASSIVPWTPAETWTRKYGDCKDQATLLVALLRRQGVRAHVALLRAGRDEDVDPSLPAMGGFNHAIVYVPGKRAIWIDPTDEHARAGELPLPDQGRLALIADARTRKLVRTPLTAPAQNRVVETREIFLADLGGARVVETTEPTGTFERTYRSGVRTTKPDELREQYASYMKNTYGSDKLHDYTHSDPRDVSVPFSLRIDARDSRRYTTDLERIEMTLPAGVMFKDLPDALTSGLDQKTGEPRQHDFLLEPRYVYELRYRIHVPAGFQVAKLPADETTALGPAVFSQSFARRGQQIEAILRFDTGPAQRLEPAQFTAMRDALRKLYQSDNPSVVVEHTGMAHLAAGRTRQALAELRAVADKHPGKAVHRARLAHALLQMGMGEAAIFEARRAVAIEPALAHAHENLGWILQHDALGRRFGKGYDRAGSLAAYRKVKELDPKNVGARADLAIVLEHDAHGLRYTAGANLDKAIAEYQALRRDTDTRSFDINLLIALFRAGQYAEAERFARSMDASATRSALLIASIAATRGVKGALDEARTLVPDAAERRGVLTEAGDTLRSMRMYKEAVSLLSEAARGASNASALQMSINILKHIQPHQDVKLVDQDPRSVARRMMLLLFDPGDVDEKTWRALVAKGARNYLDLDAFLAGEGTAPGAVRAAKKKNDGMHLEAMRDAMLGMFKVEVETQAAWGVRLRLKARVPGMGDGTDVFAVRQGGRYWLVGTANNRVPLAAYALSWADKGKLDPARQWLDWARGDDATLDRQARSNPFFAPAFAMLWHKDGPRDRERIRIAAASLLASHERGAGRALPILERCARGKDADSALQCKRALLEANQALGAMDRVLALASELALRYPDEPELFGWQTMALSKLKRWSELDALANRHIAADANRDWAWETLLMNTLERGDLAAAWRLRDRIPPLTWDALGSGAANNLAWASLFDSKVRDAARELAERVVQQDGRKHSTGLNTLAAIHAAQSDLHRAHQVMIEAMDADDAVEVRSQDWLVYGRIAQGYGLDDIARAAYRRLEPPKEDSATSSYALARRWLAELGK